MDKLNMLTTNAAGRNAGAYFCAILSDYKFGGNAHRPLMKADESSFLKFKFLFEFLEEIEKVSELLKMRI